MPRSTTSTAARAGVLLRWAGLITVAFGIASSAWTAVLVVQAETGFGAGPARDCCPPLATAALGAILASMFFVLVGAILVLLGRILERALPEGPSPRWVRWLPPGLFVYGLCIFVLSAVLAANGDQLGEAGGGIVTFCVLSFVGLLLVASGIHRINTTP